MIRDEIDNLNNNKVDIDVSNYDFETIDTDE